MEDEGQKGKAQTSEGRGRRVLDYLGGRKFIGLLIAVGVYLYKGLSWELVTVIGLYFGVNLFGKGILNGKTETIRLNRVGDPDRPVGD